jgi:hypothetical protein
MRSVTIRQVDTMAQLHLDPLWFCGPGDEAAQRQAMIAKAAYFRALRRGFAAGHALEDWLAAEQEVYRLIAGVTPPTNHAS